MMLPRYLSNVAGGLARDKRPEDFDPRQLSVGTSIEYEHTSDSFIARKIAMDHLTEDPDYYKKLLRFVESEKS